VQLTVEPLASPRQSCALTANGIHPRAPSPPLLARLAHSWLLRRVTLPLLS
jgi:hypothetical protein